MVLIPLLLQYWLPFSIVYLVNCPVGLESALSIMASAILLQLANKNAAATSKIGAFMDNGFWLN
jgi:hypothetical protein